jgi:CRP-like cAMP-binding protein
MTTPTSSDLAAVPLFASLSPGELQAAAQFFTVRSYPKDAIVAIEGDRLDMFNIILAGKIQWFWSDEAGHQLQLQAEGPGGHFADTTLAGEPILMSMIALEHLRIASIPMTEFRHMLLRNRSLRSPCSWTW